MTKGSPTTAGGGAVVAKKERPQGQAYVVVSVYQFRADRVGILVDILEQESAKTDLISVDAEAIGRDMVEKGRMVLDGLYFDFDKATLQSTSKPALEQITIYLKENPNLKFYVVGHTDSKGTFSYNLKLSQDRAHSVVKVLISEYGVPPTQIEAHGTGPLNPVFSNSTDAGREKNRRVELVER